VTQCQYQNNGYLNCTTVKTLKTENLGANDTGVILYRNNLNNLPKIKLSKIEQNRIQMGGQHGDTCTSTVINLLCSPYVHAFSSPTVQAKCSILLKKTSSKSPGFIKCRPRCLNLNAVKALQSQRTCNDFQMPVCIYHIRDCLPVPIKTSVPFNHSVPLLLSLFLAGF
jgi:hypothetical protein